MQKSIYQNQAFADYWNERAGNNGEAYKRYVLDPLMFELVGSFTDKVVLELGCGNGYLASKLLEQSPEQIIMTMLPGSVRARGDAATLLFDDHRLDISGDHLDMTRQYATLDGQPAEVLIPDYYEVSFADDLSTVTVSKK